jgi:hypothetical protein
MTRNGGLISACERVETTSSSVFGEPAVARLLALPGSQKLTASVMPLSGAPEGDAGAECVICMSTVSEFRHLNLCKKHDQGGCRT